MTPNMVVLNRYKRYWKEANCADSRALTDASSLSGSFIQHDQHFKTYKFNQPKRTTNPFISTPDPTKKEQSWWIKTNRSFQLSSCHPTPQPIPTPTGILAQGTGTDRNRLIIRSHGIATNQQIPKFTETPNTHMDQGFLAFPPRGFPPIVAGPAFP